MSHIFKKLSVIFFLALFITAQIILPVRVSALDDDTERFYSINEIGFYDPNACKNTPGILAVQLAGNDNTEKILSFFMQKGLTLAQAAGFVGNMKQESGLNPAIEQGGRIVDDSYVPKDGVGFGLVQWTFNGRQKPLVEFIKQMGVGITDLGGQLGFVWQELNTGYQSTLSALKATDDPVEAAIIIHDKYEVSADSAAAVRSVRGGHAKEVYDKYKDAPPLASPSTGGENNAATMVSQNSKKAKQCDHSFGGGDLSQTVMAYAWPNYKGLTVEATEAYKTAIQTARSKGHYIGGTTYPGIDCGGFVTTLMVDSRFESGYNYGGELSKGAGATSAQMKWLEENWQPISATDAGDRQPGDVAINSAHTYVYVGDIPGFDSKIASASLNERAPMAGQEGVTDSSFKWFRKKTGVSPDIEKKV